MEKQAKKMRDLAQKATKPHPAKKQKWEDLSTGSRVRFIVAGAVQLALAVSAWVDLGRRPAQQVRGAKGLWAAVIAINYVGPIAYFAAGRRPAD